MSSSNRAAERDKAGRAADRGEPLQTAPQSPAQTDQNSKSELDRRLDAALQETFPASDPVSVVIC